jgi:alpha-D-ribose 1-methylphosphonate 5-triphosphate diphosphatase
MLSNPTLTCRLTGAHVLRDGQMQARSTGIAGGRIVTGPLPEVDLRGFLILPGIIDLHGDAFERHIAPRPTAPFPLDMGLRGVDRDAAAHGVTTAWLAQSWSWEGGMRSPEFAEDLAAALDAYRPQALIDLRLQIRFETHVTDSADRLISLVRRHGIDLVIFNDHLAEAEETWQSRPQDVELWAKRSGRTGAELMQAVRAARAQAPAVPAMLRNLAQVFDDLGVSYGSHDDANGETREFFSAIGARICEFPLNLPVAQLAHAMGEPVLMGAPNVVRGGSQAGNVAARTLIAAGKCDALVSDYHYPALAQAAFALVDQGLLDLPAAWAMISTRPADIMRLADRGVIAPGKRADLVIVNQTTRAIEGTIVAGRIAHLSGLAAERFMGVARPFAVAAA